MQDVSEQCRGNLSLCYPNSILLLFLRNSRSGEIKPGHERKQSGRLRIEAEAGFISSS